MGCLRNCLRYVHIPIYLIIKSFYIKDENSMLTYRLDRYFNEQWYKNSISKGKTSSVDVKKKTLILLNVTNISHFALEFNIQDWVGERRHFHNKNWENTKIANGKNHVFHNTFTKSIDFFLFFFIPHTILKKIVISKSKTF